MASRKTVFGIGLPPDLLDAARNQPGGRDPQDDSGPTAEGDHSAPTVIDDEKVAEGLRQLRSWYQGDAQQPGGAPSTNAGPPPPADALAASHARPTAMGHATGPPPSVQQRQMAPDPMRATMYGHDIHRFDFDSLPAAAEATPISTPPATSTALVVSDPEARETRLTSRSPAGGEPAQGARSPSGGFQLASIGNGEALRLQRPPDIRRSSQEHKRPRAAGRQALTSRITLGVGLTAIVIALLVSLRSRNESDAALPMPAPAPTAVPAPVAAPLPLDRSAAAPGTAGQRAAPVPAPTPVAQTRSLKPASPAQAAVPVGRTAATPPATKPRSLPARADVEVQKTPNNTETAAKETAAAVPEKTPEKTPASISAPPPDRAPPARRKVDGTAAKTGDGPARRKLDPAIYDDDATLPPSEE